MTYWSSQLIQQAGILKSTINSGEMLVASTSVTAQ